MGVTAGSILVLLGFVALGPGPLVLGLIAARSNARYAPSRSRGQIFWALVGTYLGIASLIGLAEIANQAHPSWENYVGVFLGGVFTLGTAPGSFLPFLGAYTVAMGWLPRPGLFPSVWDWFVLDAICIQFFFIVGIRWLSQSRIRQAARQTSTGVTGEVE